MKLTRLWLMSFCCGLLCLSTVVQCSESSGGSGGSGGSSSGVVSSKRAGKDNNTLKKDMTSEQSTIYNIKQLEMKDRLTVQQQKQKQQQQQHKQPHQQQQLRQHSEKVKHNNRTPQQHHVEEHQQQHQQQHKLLMKQQQKLQKEQLQSLGIAPKMASDGSGNKQRSKKLKNSTKNSHGLNKKLLNKLGFTKVKAPNSHNRKRLAVESRRHASPDDSHMFIIKLPPNMNYYSNPKANNGIDNTKNSILQQAAAASKTIAAAKHHHHENAEKHNGGVATTPATTALEALNNNGKKVSFPFASNGRPGRIYHWNLPVLQKILDEKHRFSNMHKSTKDQLIDIKDVPTWSKPWENDTVEKSYSKANYKKSLKRKSPTYYAPANAVNKNSFNKYFAGNGKPKGFYVIKEDQKKPLYFKNIIS